MFLALCAKTEKKWGGRGVEGGGGGETASTQQIKKKKTVAKNGGAICTRWQNVNYYIYI